MKTWWRRLVVPATSTDKTAFRLPLPIIKTVLWYAPAANVGFKIDTAKQSVIPLGSDDAANMVWGVGTLVALPVDYEIDGRPYEITITTINNEAVSQAVNLGLILEAEQMSEIDLLQQILMALGKFPGFEMPARPTIEDSARHRRVE